MLLHLENFRYDSLSLDMLGNNDKLQVFSELRNKKQKQLSSNYPVAERPKARVYI